MARIVMQCGRVVFQPRAASMVGKLALLALATAGWMSRDVLVMDFTVPSASNQMWRMPSRTSSWHWQSRSRRSGVERNSLPLSERTYLITGSTNGIGKQVAKRLADAGATVIIHGKQERLVEHTMNEIVLPRREDRSFDQGKVDGYVSDFGSLREVSEFADLVAEEHPIIDGILHNAATMDGDYRGTHLVTRDGNEHTLSVNVLAPFLLTSRLRPNLAKAGLSRVVFTGSKSMFDSLRDLNFEATPCGSDAYGLSKLCTAMMALEMDARYGDAPRQTFHVIHPGSFATQLSKHSACFARGKRKYRRFTRNLATRFGMLPSAKYANRSFEAMVSDEFAVHSGLCDLDPADCPPQLFEPEARKRLWDDLVELTGAQWDPVEVEESVAELAQEQLSV
eukprot:CAMPEP_0178412990 /NCGR_PEP_ID=MMETSP0689_2-20121128/22299_1 /TAXON_ID=160604 /ORGANISM="Amphidinium massartii, Strain CS-259" /LENGTH=393 /DNA_ID=CAMNT_0020034253 /DNA_START=32 /DNA_END=1213 /DNA_ORIENTATION=-